MKDHKMYDPKTHLTMVDETWRLVFLLGMKNHLNSHEEGLKQLPNINKPYFSIQVSQDKRFQELKILEFD